MYDPSTHRYDHHQREFTGVLDGFKTKLSSAGLVYKHFGRSILNEALRSESGETPSSDFLDVCYTKLYKDFMEHVDAIDNGISVAEGEIRYHVSTTMSSRVGMLNPAWNEEQSSDIQNERFKSAMLLTCSEFLAHAQGLAKSWWPARSIVKSALDERLEVHSSGKVIILPQACPWKDHLFELEAVVSSARRTAALECLTLLLCTGRWAPSQWCTPSTRTWAAPGEYRCVSAKLICVCLCVDRCCRCVCRRCR